MFEHLVLSCGYPFGKAGQSLGGGASLKEVGHWERVVRLYTLALFPDYYLLPYCQCHVTSTLLLLMP